MPLITKRGEESYIHRRYGRAYKCSKQKQVSPVYVRLQPICVIYGPTDNEKHIPFSDRPKSNYHPMSARRQRHTLHSKLRYSQQMFICLAIPEGDIHESVRREHALRLFLIDTLSVPQHVRANLPRETSPIPNVGHSVASIFEDPFFPR